MSTHLLEIRPRQTVFESYYVEHLHSSSRFLIAEPEDFGLIMRYVNEVVYKADPLVIETGISKEDYQKLYAECLKECLQSKFTILATDCFEICGLISGKFVSTGNGIETNGNCASQLSNENGKIKEIRTFLHELNSRIMKFLPNNSNKYFQIELFNVRADYQRSGIGTKLLKELLRLVQKSEVSAVSLISTDLITNQIVKKMKMESKFSLLYPNSNGKQIESQLMIVNLHEIEELLVKDPPSLPNAYKLPNLKRKKLGDHFAKRLGRPLEYFIAEPGDADVIKDFLMNEYFRQTAVTRTLQCQKSDGLELITRFKPDTLKLGTTLIAIDNGKICGLAVNKLVEFEHPTTKLDSNIPEDFSEEIDKQTLTHLGSKAIRALCAWMDSLTPQMLPEDCKRYYVLDMLTVHPTYRGCKIGWKLWYESLKNSMELGYRYTQTICTAIASNKLATEFGLKKMIEFPYIQLKYNGKHLFEDGTVYDGGKVICMYIGNSKDLKLDN